MIITPKEEWENLSYGSQKKLLYRCDDCSVKKELIYRNYYKSQEKRGWDGKTYCGSCAVKKSNQNRDYKSKGFYISSDGYKMIKTNKKKNGSGWSCYEKEHKVIAEEKISRKLKKGEVVHHIDGDKLNNFEENLHVCKNSMEHRLAHTSLQDIGYELYKLGFIKFNKSKSIYELTKETKDIIGEKK